MFEQLDFIYQPSRDAAADLEHYVHGFGAEPVFAIERFGTRVAMVRWTADSPGLLLAEHLAEDQAILIFRVQTSRKPSPRSGRTVAGSATDSRCRTE